jgi:beta-phosphoglucomutase-like phosphatase (HAD superfamily)
MIKVIIFDLDGLLIDSQPLQYKAYNQIFSKYGFPITKKEWQDDWIHNSISCKKWIKKKNLPLDFEKVRAEKKRLYEKLILTDLELKSGANNAINSLLAEYRLCIASASMKSSIDI